MWDLETQTQDGDPSLTHEHSVPGLHRQLSPAPQQRDQSS